ncbi:MAG TPA: hypothetical protein VMS09_07795 [Paenibacillus sp.]|uniref:hypothetical protein n=1 Tax=Paenibacillus sp. TaxID=58172 RepID=UPI002D157AD0|nr:hypothetical protein [Paenibacillus sp.]HUC91915.1 hypothetical protein [Paenibacillus sp.]
MVHSFIIEPAAYIAFDSEAEQIDKCKAWGLLSGKASKTKTFAYKGNGMNLTCSIIGYVDKMTAVIEFDTKQRHCIHPSYLKEMQAANYGQKLAAATEGLEEPESAEAEHAQTEMVEPQIAEPQSVKLEAPQEAAPPVEEAKLEAEEPTAEEPAKAKAKKTPKPQLPEEKVRMTATVKEFTMVPNHFSDTEDEVVIYEAVSIEQPETEIGTAWSSHSATLKKLELEAGDTIRFEGKIVAKKLTKHPVPYKINNPAKIEVEKA